MPIDFSCPECAASLRVKDEHAGKKMKCPQCGRAIPIPQTSSQEVVEVEVVEEAPADSADNPFAFEDIDRPRGKKSEPAVVNQPSKSARSGPRYAACPHCGAQEARKVNWTWWGSWYGPRLFHVVRCQECGGSFNGKTGETVLIPLLVFVTVPLVMIVILLALMIVMLKRAGVL